MLVFGKRLLIIIGIFATVYLIGCDRLGLGPTPTPTPTTTATPSTVAASPSAPATPGPFDANTFVAMSAKAQAQRIPVIMYHDITNGKAKDAVYFDCTAEEFEKEITWLEEQGASFISLEQLHRNLTRGEELPPNPVVLTFDDNYQGFYDNAYPLIKQKQIHVAMFVHTNFVGDTKKRPHMNWDTLRELDKDGLVTIGSHTLSHPDDITKIPIEDQSRELRESKDILEREIGHPIPYFAYPNGNWDPTVADEAMSAGYTMAFTIHNGPAEESPGILSINRYINSRYKDAWKECQDAAANAPAAYVDIAIANNPVILQVKEFGGVKLGIVRGGKPATWRATDGRASVGEFVKMADESHRMTEPVVGGMNGTFFADAALRGTSNVMIGPCLTRGEGVFYPEEAEYRLPKLLNRPLVLWNDSRLIIVPFNPAAMNNENAIKDILPDATDVFLAGAWIVHDGTARTKEQMGAYSARDFNDPRRRAFFGISDSGDIVLGGSLDVITTEMLAKAAAAAGVKEAVLMDSGFSTSIVYDNKIIVTGHTAKNLPSRPVPHAIVVAGKLDPPTDPESQKAYQDGEPAVGAISAMEAQAQAPHGDVAAGSSTSSGSGRRRRHR